MRWSSPILAVTLLAAPVGALQDAGDSVVEALRGLDSEDAEERRSSQAFLERELVPGHLGLVVQEVGSLGPEGRLRLERVLSSEGRMLPLVAELLVAPDRTARELGAVAALGLVGSWHPAAAEAPLPFVEWPETLRSGAAITLRMTASGNLAEDLGRLDASGELAARLILDPRYEPGRRSVLPPRVLEGTPLEVLLELCGRHALDPLLYAGDGGPAILFIQAAGIQPPRDLGSVLSLCLGHAVRPLDPDANLRGAMGLAHTGWPTAIEWLGHGALEDPAFLLAALMASARGWSSSALAEPDSLGASLTAMFDVAETEPLLARTLQRGLSSLAPSTAHLLQATGGERPAGDAPRALLWQVLAAGLRPTDDPRTLQALRAEARAGLEGEGSASLKWAALELLTALGPAGVEGVRTLATVDWLLEVPLGSRPLLVKALVAAGYRPAEGQRGVAPALVWAAAGESLPAAEALSEVRLEAPGRELFELCACVDHLSLARVRSLVEALDGAGQGPLAAVLAAPRPLPGVEERLRAALEASLPDSGLLLSRGAGSARLGERCRKAMLMRVRTDESLHEVGLLLPVMLDAVRHFGAPEDVAELLPGVQAILDARVGPAAKALGRVLARRQTPARDLDLEDRLGP